MPSPFMLPCRRPHSRSASPYFQSLPFSVSILVPPFPFLSLRARVWDKTFLNLATRQHGGRESKKERERWGWWRRWNEIFRNNERGWACHRINCIYEACLPRGFLRIKILAPIYAIGGEQEEEKEEEEDGQMVYRVCISTRWISIINRRKLLLKFPPLLNRFRSEWWSDDEWRRSGWITQSAPRFNYESFSICSTV